MPEISVVLPTYNGERFIRESIESVIHQTFQDWELIIVDDCSTDHTPEIAEEYAKQDSRIRVIHNAVNQKLPESLNIGFRQARGNYLTWTSDDNRYAPKALETMYAFLERYVECPMIVADTLIHDVTTGEERIQAYDPQKMFRDNQVGACFLYRAGVRTAIGEYRSDLFCVEDYEYWLRVLKHYGYIARLPEVLYYYRLQPRSLTAQKESLIEAQRRKLYREDYKWFGENLKSDCRGIVKIYNELIMDGIISETEIRDYFSTLIPAIKYDCDLPDNARVILFGAGNYGRQILNILHERVEFFADHDENKIGREYNGVKVLSFNEMVFKVKNDPSFHIVLAASFEIQHQMMEELHAKGVENFTVAAHCFKIPVKSI